MVRKIRVKLVLQLRAEGLSGRAIAASQGMTRKSITAVLEAADTAVWFGMISPTVRTAGSKPGCSRAAVSIKACSYSRTGTRSTGR